MRSKLIATGGRHRSFRTAVWTGRIIGWLLLLAAILTAVQAEFFGGATTDFRLFPPVVLGVLATGWIVVLELFLHFFDRYLSGN